MLGPETNQLLTGFPRFNIERFEPEKSLSHRKSSLTGLDSRHCRLVHAKFSRKGTLGNPGLKPQIT